MGETQTMADESYITEDFLLESKSARKLYHECAEALPIIDYHTHLSPALIANDHQFANMTELWLAGDHYKWRAMRTNGVAERLCTGDASDWEKFEAWAATMPHLLRNPLHHWTHLEFQRFFDISDRLLGPDTAKAIWDECNEKLKDPSLSCRGILMGMRVELVCTTDDPTDSLEHHCAIAEDDSFTTTVLPTWRPDRAMAIEVPESFNVWVDKLAEVADVEIRDFDLFLNALKRRHQVFHEMGCRLSDHGLSTIPSADFTAAEIDSIFKAVRSGKTLNVDQIERFQSAMMFEFGFMDFEAGWTQQMHIGPIRNTRSRMMQSFGPDAGCDSIGDIEVARPLSTLLDRLDRIGKLPRTILYNHNPRDTAVFITMVGNFQEGPQSGKVQVGPPWWFLDNRDGIERMIEDLSQLSLISRFVGMVTDSRSFLSATRHEYFRRIVCNILGSDMERGLIPNDFDAVGQMVKDICYWNAERYFGFFDSGEGE